MKDMFALFGWSKQSGALGDIFRDFKCENDPWTCLPIVSTATVLQKIDCSGDSKSLWIAKLHLEDPLKIPICGRYFRIEEDKTTCYAPPCPQCINVINVIDSVVHPSSLSPTWGRSIDETANTSRIYTFANWAAKAAIVSRKVLSPFAANKIKTTKNILVQHISCRGLIWQYGTLGSLSKFPRAPSFREKLASVNAQKRNNHVVKFQSELLTMRHQIFLLCLMYSFTVHNLRVEETHPSHILEQARATKNATLWWFYPWSRLYTANLCKSPKLKHCTLHLSSFRTYISEYWPQQGLFHHVNWFKDCPWVGW